MEKSQTSEIVRQLQNEVGALLRGINKIHTKHLNVAIAKDDIRSFVNHYFGECRLAFVSTGILETDLAEVDSYMQDLLRCAQRRTRVKAYKDILRDVKDMLHEIELKSVMPTTSAKYDIKHQKILETLAKVSPSAAASYEQGLLDLLVQRKSWRGTATEFREALRETLDTLAPDKEVKMQPDFKLEPNTTGPTMKQKAIFILRSRHKQVKVFTTAIDIIEELTGKFVRSVYGRSSAATHTPASEDEVLRIRDYVALALTELLEIKV